MEGPNIMLKPTTQNTREPMEKSITFFIMMLPTFLARVKPDSTMAKPACIKNTSTAASKTQMVSIALASIIVKFSQINYCLLDVKGFRTRFTGANLVGAFHIRYKDSSIPDLSRAGRLNDGFNGALHILIAYHYRDQSSFDTAGVVHRSAVRVSFNSSTHSA